MFDAELILRYYQVYVIFILNLLLIDSTYSDINKVNSNVNKVY